MISKTSRVLFQAKHLWRILAYDLILFLLFNIYFTKHVKYCLSSLYIVMTRECHCRARITWITSFAAFKLLVFPFQSSQIKLNMWPVPSKSILTPMMPSDSKLVLARTFPYFNLLVADSNVDIEDVIQNTSLTIEGSSLSWWRY